MTKLQNELRTTRELTAIESLLLACESVTAPDLDCDGHPLGKRDLNTLTETFEYPAFVG